VLLLNLSGESHGVSYDFKYQLYEKVNLEESKWNTKGRNIIMNIVKADPDQDYWPRLTKDKIKNVNINVDWSRYIDEDEEAELGSKGMEDMDMAGM
jgi:hypothetical protein